MAKALLGHLGGNDPHLEAELAQLRRRVRDLESEVARLSATNEALTSLVAESQLATVALVEIPVDIPVGTAVEVGGDREPALA